MHRLTVSYPTPDDPEHFLSYYVDKHLPLARQLPGLIACRYLRPKALGPAAAVPFLLFEGDFENVAAMYAAIGSPVGATVAGDVPNYSPKGATLYHYEV